MFLVAAALVITGLLVLGLEYTRFGARVRACVDNQRMARGLGLNVDAVFSITFALGSGLAGLGGALGIEIVGLDPNFAFKYLVYMLIVVAVGGLASIRGAFVTAAMLGIIDIVSKYYVPEIGAFVLYLVMVSFLVWRPAGLFARRYVTVTTAPALATLNPRELLRAQVKWRHLETLFWLATLLPFLVAPTYLILGSQIAITALFALSLDLIVGYAGLVSLGHAAFFGFGAYAAGLIAKAGWGEPITGLLCGGLRRHGARLSDELHHRAHQPLRADHGDARALPLALRSRQQGASGSPAGTTACRAYRCGRCSGMFQVRSLRSHRLRLLAGRAVPVFLVLRRLINSPFGLSLRGIRENARRMPAIGAPSQQPHIRTIYTIAAAFAGIAGGLLAQTTKSSSLEDADFQRSAEVLVMLVLGGAGPALWRHPRRHHFHGGA